MKKRRKNLKWLLLLIPLAAGILFYGVYRSYRDPIVTQVTIESPKVDQPIRYVLISDLHEKRFGDNNSQLYEMIRSLEPDFILIAGDLINWTSSDDNYAVDTIKNLAEIAKVYCCLGNHEIEYMNFRGQLEITGNDWSTASFNITESEKKNYISELREAGAVVLQRKWKKLKVRDVKIRIGAAYEGMYSLDEEQPQKTLLQGMDTFLTDYQDTSSLKLYMTHRPSSFLLGNASKLWDIDVVMSGHEHGGQIVLPFIGGVYSRERGFFPGYTHGTFQFGETTFVVTSGLGSDKESFPRFNNPPEIVMITIK